MSLYLGLDSSTQSLSAILIDTASGELLLEESVNFGADLPHYNSPSGFIPHADDAVRHSDPLMWVEALELLLTALKDRGAPLADVRAISGSGQQHGSVYLNSPITGGWDAAIPLAPQVAPQLSRKTAPIWMDSSTSQQCQEIAVAVGGNPVLSKTTGSPAIERFTGPQIRRFSQLDPAGYAATNRIHLVSSFMASLLAGTDVPIDFGDGAGMNLMNLATESWDPACLAATADQLERRLPGLAAGNTVVGTIAPYFSERFGFSASAKVTVWSGDNPNSLIGMGAHAPGTVVISLGTSDTFFAPIDSPRTDPNGYGHVFGNPAGGFMSLICFTNGSLAREAVAEEFGLDWDAFAQAIADTPPGNNGNLMVPYFVPETTPRVPEALVKRLGSPDFQNGKYAAAAARAVVEAQAISMRLNSTWITDRPTAIRVTGGASQNRGITQVLADVFGAPLQRLTVGNSAGLGAAMRAANADGVSFAALNEVFSTVDPDFQIMPGGDYRELYDELTSRFVAATEAG